MKLYELKPAKGSTKKRKIVGRGVGSGHGVFSGRGCKGQKARSGYSRRPSFEGGRTPLYMQIPKLKGFKSKFARPEIVNVLDLEKKFENNDVINKKRMFEVGLIKSVDLKVKILGKAKLKKKLQIETDYISKGAKDSIIKIGGNVKIITTTETQRKNEEMTKSQ